MVLNLKNENFNEEIKEGKVVVDFFATWCGPCKMLSPILESIGEERSEIKVIKIDVDEHQELAREFGVMSIPTLLYYKDGTLLKKQVGFTSKENILETFK